jgi:hypothetical protein
MAGVMVPICAIRYPDEQAFAIEAVDVLYLAGHLDDDSFTSSARVRVVHEPDREEMRLALREKLASAEAERLIRFLDDHDWDAVFLIDGRE